MHRLAAIAVRTLASAAALAVAGCAATGGLQSDGTYTLESSEQSMNCQRLSNGVWSQLQLLKSLPEKASIERQTEAPTAVAAFGRMFGADHGLAALAEYDRERAHLRSLQQIMMDKGCPPLDVERELAATETAIANFRSPP